MSLSNLSIAQSATLQRISDVAESAGLRDSDYEPLGRYKAKLTWQGVEALRRRPHGKLVLVTAITPTKAGEGKTTMTVGLAQGLRKLGRRAAPAIREPALGPVFGVKGGACGGGYSQVLPIEDINLFFTGDYPAIQAAHNLLAAMVDAQLHHGNALGFDVRRPAWPRTLDMNDRALRQIIVGLGGPGNGFAREDQFVITAASEVMAVLCMAHDLADLRARLGRMMVGMGGGGRPIVAEELEVAGAMTVLLRDALRPNFVQTLEGGPAFVHGGPFANIAHGCSSLLATQCSLGLNEYTVTEAGFASDLGAEKFLNILVPRLEKAPEVIVLVATVQALKLHGQGDLTEGLANLTRHLGHLRQYGPPVVVAVNRFASDHEDELRLILDHATVHGARAAIADPWNRGGEGCLELARWVDDLAGGSSSFQPLYSEEEPLETKLQRLVARVYGGESFALSEKAQRRLDWMRKHNLPEMPVCVAKTQYSLSDQPELTNAPHGFKVQVREIHPSLGAGFVVAMAGEVMLMPGLGKAPAAQKIDLDADGRVVGMF